ncbi:unnamed protein product [Phytophthora lilii]|uniref:Unnamed protein product n=1 Tax=Phytophthora lilii TaxID=2077276 RepID=A0A9W6TDD7_9STRA|nr:unnamed protein product [Phytophthora lilii]
MTKLRVIVGFAAAATATATIAVIDKASAQHLRSDGEGRVLEAETAFLDSIASTEGSSLADEFWDGEDNDDEGSDVDAIDDVLNSCTATPQPSTKSPTSDPTPATDASTSAAPAATEPVDSSSAAAATETPAAMDVTAEPVSSTVIMTPATAGQLAPIKAWRQCGGITFDYTKYFADGISSNWTVDTKLSCSQGFSCEVINRWYFQCQKYRVKSSSEVDEWGQCGGVDYEGLTKCVVGSECKLVNDWYSQCIPTEDE